MYFHIAKEWIQGSNRLVLRACNDEREPEEGVIVYNTPVDKATDIILQGCEVRIMATMSGNVQAVSYY